MRTGISSAFVAAAIFLVPAAHAQPATAPSPLIGTWKLDPAASKFTSGQSLQSETRTYEMNGDKISLTATGVDGSGNPTKYSYTAAYDGKFYPMTGNPVGDSIALKRVDDRTIEATLKKGDAVSGYGKTTISPDGERFTLTRKMMRGKDAPAVDELAFVKQH